MTWPVIARRELRELAANNTTLVFAVLFALLGAGTAYGSTNSGMASPLSDVIAIIAMLAVPLVAGTLTHEAVPRDVTSGRLRLTLSLPHSRTAFLAGVGAARLAIVVGLLVVAALAGLCVYVIRGPAVDPFSLLGLVAVSGLLGAAFVATTLASTARSRSTTLSAATTHGFFLLAFLWPAAVELTRIFLHGQFGVAVGEPLANGIIQFSPIYAFQGGASAVGVSVSPPPGPIPDWGGVVVLSAWAVGGFALAATRFRRVNF